MRLGKLVACGASAGVLLLGAGSSPANAHPLGNLTVNTAAHLVVAPDEVRVEYVLDLAELPAVQERGRVSAAGSDAAYVTGKCQELGRGLTLAVGDAAVPLQAGTSSLEHVPGQGGLDTLRVTCEFAAPLTDADAVLTWRDANFVDRIGWREVSAQGDGVTLATTLAPVSPSAMLRAYPSDVPAPRVLDAQLTSAAGGPRLAAADGTSAASEPQRRGADGLTATFNGLVADRHLSVGLGLVAAGIAFLLGALHSLAPGHGKTLMAAMVASRRGTLRQVAAVGGTVAFTHTMGVVVLGIVITSSQAVAPDRVLPWLTVASGLLLLATGAWLLTRRVLFGAATGHSHGTFGHHHAHGEHDHPHPHPHPHPHAHDGPVRTRSLALVGMAGGLVPTPSALVVLLGATALGRAWFGVVLVAIYGIGMAATLLAAGMLLVKLQGWLERQYADARWLTFGLRVLPLATATLLVLGGMSLAVRGAASI